MYCHIFSLSTCSTCLFFLSNIVFLSFYSRMYIYYKTLYFCSFSSFLANMYADTFSVLSLYVILYFDLPVFLCLSSFCFSLYFFIISFNRFFIRISSLLFNSYPFISNFSFISLLFFSIYSPHPFSFFFSISFIHKMNFVTNFFFVISLIFPCILSLFS